MHSAFEKREKAFENKFFHEEGLRFQIISKRRKLLGQWAAKHMNLHGDAVKAYALDIVTYGVEDNREGAVVNRILKDLQAHDIAVSEEDIRDKMDELHEVAEDMILRDIKPQ